MVCRWLEAGGWVKPWPTKLRFSWPGDSDSRPVGPQLRCGCRRRWSPPRGCPPGSRFVPFVPGCSKRENALPLRTHSSCLQGEFDANLHHSKRGKFAACPGRQAHSLQRNPATTFLMTGQELHLNESPFCGRGNAKGDSSSWTLTQRKTAGWEGPPKKPRITRRYLAKHHLRKVKKNDLQNNFSAGLELVPPIVTMPAG